MKWLLCILLFFPFTSRCQTALADSIITKTAVQASLNFLASDSLEGRLTGSAGAAKAAGFIAGKFVASGLQPFNQNSYYDSFPAFNYNKKVVGVNIVGYLPGKEKDDSVIIISAHYDHLGKWRDLPGSTEYDRTDDIYNGANDNATGTVAMLELAKFYAIQNIHRYRIMFIAFAGEELGLIGSKEFVKKQKGLKVKALINLEMLGRPYNNNCYIITLKNNKTKEQLNKTLQQYIPGEENFFVSDPYYDDNLAYRSDHYPFSSKTKNAFTIMATSPSDEFYHTVNDEAETIDLDFLTRATKYIALAVECFTQ